jgi:putative protease
MAEKKKAAKKKVAKKKVAAKAKPKQDEVKEKEIGQVMDYYGKIGVVAMKLTKGGLAAGDEIHIIGHTTDTSVKIKTMQIEHETVEKAKKGAQVGIKCKDKCRRTDKVYLKG